MTRRGAIRSSAHLAALAVVVWAVAAELSATQHDVNVLAWLVAGAVLHDLVVLPAYVLADRAVRRSGAVQRLNAANHLRVPAILSLVLLLVYAPSILGRTAANFRRVSGRPPATHPLEAWALITLGLFAASAVLLTVRHVRASRRRA